MAQRKSRNVSSVPRRPVRVRGQADAQQMTLFDVPAPPKPKGADSASFTARAEEDTNNSPFLTEALRRSEGGDDSMLLPYQPTPSINPPRPRTLAAGYDPDTKTLRVRFRDGALYAYNNVNKQTWANFKRVKSPGKAINRYFPPGSNYEREQ